ncbi:transcription elongation factor spt5 [Coemansia spiralis]|nr:transcription elongation factor spt5 [Coemansia spiralis]
MADVEDMFDSEPAGRRYSSDEEDESQSLGTRRRRQNTKDRRGAKVAAARDEDDDEDDDEEDEEDEDDEDDDDERDYKKPQAKKTTRKKRPRTNNFLDIEATVDTDEEEEDEDDGALDDFIVDNEELATAEKDALRQRAAARPPVFQDDETLDADAIEAQLRERYSGYAASGGRGTGSQIDADWVPQRLIIPGINDPHLWVSRCSPGKERDIVLAVGRRVLQWASSGKYKGVYSAYTRSGLSGSIYVEARTQADALAALEGVPGVFTSKLMLVPINDMIDVVKVKTHAARLNPGSWVRVKRGNYAGDLAQVASVIESSDAVEVRLLPRLDYSGDGRRDKRTRPPQRLFSVDDAQKADSRSLTSRQNEILWKGDRFINGYLHKDMRTISLQTEDVNPTLEEIALFAAGETGEDGDEQAAIAALANQAAAASNAMEGIDQANGLTARDLQPGESVEVVEGDLAGVAGVVRSIEGEVVRIEPELGALRHGGATGGGARRLAMMSFRPHQLRKRFAAGDHVKVLNGRHTNETGMVVNVADAVVTVFTDIGGSEIRVLAKDLRTSSDIGTSLNGARDVLVGLDVHDLVHMDGNQMGIVLKVSRDTLTVLDDQNETRTMAPRAVRPARGGFERTGADFNGVPLRRGDMAREAAGARRQGTVVQVTRFVAFLKLQGHSGSDSVIALRTRQAESMSGRQGSLDPYATRTMRAGPGDRGRGRGRGGGPGGPGGPGGRLGSLRGGRDPLVSKTVIANRGPYKGYAGIVKDVTGTLVRVELHTNARVVSVEKDKLSVRLPSGETVPATDFVGDAPAYGDSGPRPASTSSRPMPADDSSGWGAPPSRGSYGGTQQAAAASPAPGYGGWDGAAPASAAGGASGGWDAPTPSGMGGGGGGGWDTGPAAASTPQSGWGTSGRPAAGAGNWGTPGPFTPGALPQTPGGPFPQTPGSSYYDAPTPGARGAEPAADGFFGWAVPRAMVVLGASGQRGTIKDVAAERQQAIIQLDSGSTQVVDRSSVARLDPRPVRAEKRDRVIVIRGPRKGALGTMVGKDGSEAFFQADGDPTWHPEQQRNLAIYNDRM